MDFEATYAVMYFEINILAIILVSIILFKTQGITKMVAQRNFAMSIYAEILFFFSDTIYVMISRGVFAYSSITVMIMKSIYFFATTLMCFFWFLYFEYLQDSPFIKNRKRVRISSALVWVLALLLIINTFTGILFYVDDNGKYCRGSLFILQYIIAYIYVLITSCRAFVGIFDKKKLTQRHNLIMLTLFPIAPAGAGILQYIYPHLPLACAALSIATLIIYVEYMDKMISVDPLTKLSNRKQLIYYYERWQENLADEDMYLLMIDANKFKSINDTYGHIEGDAALVRISDAMSLGCNATHIKHSISRYGGDEFAILFWTSDENEVLNLIGEINKHLSILNKEADSPYELTVSIGYAKADKKTDLTSLIAIADEKLYEVKRKIYASDNPDKK